MKRLKGGVASIPPALVGIRTSRWKCIWVPEDPRIPTELYRLEEDPLERKNLAATRPEVVAELKNHLLRLEEEAQPEKSEQGSPEEEALLKKHLRSLGYL